MIKQLLTGISLIACSVLASAQICGGAAVIDEAFSGGIPANWTVIDQDGMPLTNSMYLKGFIGQWQSYTHLGKKCVANGSQMNNPGYCDDYLITPQFTVPVGGCCLSWKASALIPAYFNEAYQLLISNTTPTVSAFLSNPVLTAFGNEQGPWTEHAIDLSAYAGQTVYIAFRHSTAGYAFFLDDIRISGPVSRDAAISTVNTSTVVSPGSQYISGLVTNRGTSTITSVNVNWSINNGTPNTDALSAISILPDSALPFASSISWMAATPGTYLLKVWTSNVNGSGDLYPANDTLTEIVFVNGIPRKPLFEDFTQASCPGCDVANWHCDSVLNPYLFTNRITTIQYHVAWPGVDPMYTYSPGVAMGRVSDYGIAFVPHGVLDGEELVNDCGAFIGASACLDSNDVNSALVHPAIFDLAVNQQTGTDSFRVDVTITSHADVPFNTLRLRTYLLEDTILYPTPPGSNNQTDFYHVARYALPDSNGTLLPAMTNGQVLTYHFSYVIDLANTDTAQFVSLAFIQDDSTCYMHQSEMSQGYSNPNGIAEISSQADLRVYPNPASNQLNVQCAAATGNVNWTIVNVLGQVSIAGIMQLPGNSSAGSIDVSALSPGIYFLNFEAGGKLFTARFVRE